MTTSSFSASGSMISVHGSTRWHTGSPPPRVHGVTLSTMHGCPPDEIEAICRYMLEEKNLNTFVKLNPTLLGYSRVREILDTCGFGYIALNEESFDHDLKIDRALEMLERLMQLAKRDISASV